MELPPPLTDFAFAPEQFEELRRLYLAGDLSREKGRLTHKPVVLGHNPDDPVVDLTAADPHRRGELAAAGRRAMQRGEVAMLSMAGGMATRFGGGAKACSRLIEGSEETFLSAVCRHVSELEAKFGAVLPWVVMTSFATNAAIHELLEREEWFGLDPARRFAFAQSVLPRIDAEGTALYEHESAASWPETLTCCAPGHGDTLGRLRDSGTLATLLDRGVKHLLVANIDNLGATLDPVVVGAHLAAVDAGADITVEVVERQAGESGGCVASVEGHAQILESFRLPLDTSLDDFPHFNTNTMWFRIEALVEAIELDWFAVKKEVSAPGGRAVEAIQFERLIGQATATLNSHFVSVPRALRFLPIKKRADLDSMTSQISARLSDLDQFSLAFS